MLSPIVEHTSVSGGYCGGGGGFDVAARSEIPKRSCQNHKQRQLGPHSRPSKEAHTRTKESEYSANIERRHQNYYQKLLEIEKEIVREVIRGDKDNLRKIANRKAQTSRLHYSKWTLICALQFANFGA